jgi:HEAT repeat protein
MRTAPPLARAALLVAAALLATAPPASAESRAGGVGADEPPAVGQSSLDPPESSRTSLDRLSRSLATDASYKVRLQAAVLLGKSGDRRAADPLLKALENDAHPTVRAACAAALASLKEPRAVPALLGRIGLDQSSFVRDEAQRSLARVPRDVGVGPAVEAFGSPHASVRRAVVTYVSAEPGPSAQALLVRALGDVPEVAAPALAALRVLPAAERTRVFAGGLEHDDPAVRRGAVEGLASEAGPDSAALVLGVFERDLEDDEVRSAARRALVTMKAHLPMQQIHKDAGPAAEKHTRGRALRLLGIIGGEGTKPLLVSALDDADPWVRGVAVMALGDLGDASVVPALEKLATDAHNEAIAPILESTLRDLRKKGPRSP